MKSLDWKENLKGMPIDWLLQQAKPLNRYYILREIVGKPEDDIEVSSLRKSLIEEIQGKQLENGSWNNKVHDYSHGTTQQLMKLKDLGLNNDEPPIRKGAEYIFRFQKENGSFTQQPPPECGVETGLVLTNSAILALARTGYATDPRVSKACQWLCSWQQEDGRWVSPNAMKRKEEGKSYTDPYCGIHATCNVLFGLGALEKTQQREAIKRGADYLLNLYGFKYDITDPIKPPYAKAIMGKKLVPFEGAWFDPRSIGPGAEAISNKEIEFASTGHVLSALSMTGYGLENKKIVAGFKRLVALQEEDGRWLFSGSVEATYGYTLDNIMTVKSFYQPLSVFSFHGH